CSKICAVKNHSTQLVKIADTLGDPSFGLSVASLNFSAMRQLLLFIADLTFSLRAQYTRKFDGI
ncbi:hypothetical protein H5410_036871, partial [Solanum commersonii]